MRRSSSSSLSFQIQKTIISNCNCNCNSNTKASRIKIRTGERVTSSSSPTATATTNENVYSYSRNYSLNRVSITKCYTNNHNLSNGKKLPTSVPTSVPILHRSFTSSSSTATALDSTKPSQLFSTSSSLSEKEITHEYHDTDTDTSELELVQVKTNTRHELQDLRSSMMMAMTANSCNNNDDLIHKKHKHGGTCISRKNKSKNKNKNKSKSKSNEKLSNTVDTLDTWMRTGEGSDIKRLSSGRNRNTSSSSSSTSNSNTVSTSTTNSTASNSNRTMRRNMEFIPLFHEVDQIMNKIKINHDHDQGTTNVLNSILDSMIDIDTPQQEQHKQKQQQRQHPPKKSIFDAFPIKPKIIHNPNAFEKHSFEKYTNMIQDILTSDKFCRKHTLKPCQDDIMTPVKEWLLKEEPLLDYDYPMLSMAVEYGIGNGKCPLIADDSSAQQVVTQIPPMPMIRKSTFRREVKIKGSESNQFLSQLMDQKQKFLSKTGFNDEQYLLIVRAFNVLSPTCARIGSNSSMSVAWEKIKEAGIIPTVEAMNTFLYVTGTMAGSGFMSSSSSFSQQFPPLRDSSSSNNLSAVMNIFSHEIEHQQKQQQQRQQQPSREKIDLPNELAIFHDLLFEPTEKTISLRVKRLVSHGHAKEAERLLDSFPSNDDVKLRTYLPILKLYCEQGNVSSALQLFKRMRDEPSVRIEPENYILILSTLMENGCFRTNANDIDGICELGYKNPSGPLLFDELMKEMADDVLEISSASARRLYNAIAEGYKGDSNMNLKPIISLAGLVTDDSEAKPDQVVASRVAVGETTGICPRTGVKLQLIKLEKHQRKQLHSSLIHLSNTRYEEFSRNDNDADYAAKHLNTFVDWLNNREGKPFTAIVDGANVAYYMQNFEGGSFNYHQIQFMVETLEKMNENPLVIIPYKYCTPSFQVRMGARFRPQFLDKSDYEILENLIQRDQLYRVPARCLDDYYWMLASVSEQRKSRNDTNLDVPVDNKEGRWPGARPMLISNDQMRDHKLGLLEPRLFRRWFGCYIVNYNFTAFVGKESVDREIGFSTADLFSREIQGNESESGTVWHIPVNDWKLDDRFCVRIPR